MSVHLARRGPHVLFLLACALSAAPAAALPVNSTGYSVESTSQAFQSQLTQGPSITVGTPFSVPMTLPQGGRYFAVASGPTQTLRSMAYHTGEGDYGGQTITSSGFSWDVVVGSGSSGLPSGAPVTLNVGLRLDGRLQARGSCTTCPLVHTGEWGNSAEARANLRFGVSDVQSPDFEEGVPDLLGFTYEGLLSFGGGDFAVNAGPIVSSHFWSLARATLQGGGLWNWAGNQEDTYTQAQGYPIGERVEDIDTGLLVFTVDTFVGHTLRFDADLETMATGGALDSSWRALSDFGNTFDAELDSPIAGLSFTNYRSGVLALPLDPGSVPEPQTGVLMLSALAVLGRLGRRPPRAAPSPA